MKRAVWKNYALWISFAEAVGLLSGLLIKEGISIYNETVIKPPLSPPDLVFPIVWGILFALMGAGAARVYMKEASRARTGGLLFFFAQLLFNFFWSIIFFRLQNFGFAFFWLIILWLLILAMIFFFRRADKPAALLQLPYALWVTFAAYLNLGVWLLNG